MFVREQPLFRRLRQHLIEKCFGYLPLDHPLAVLREHRHVPHLVVHIHPYKPAEEQVVVQLLHQQPLAAYAVEGLQQQGPQQLLRSNRWPSHARIQLREQRRHRLQRRVSHPSYPSQRMILRYPLLRRNVTEHATLLLIVSAHVLLDAATPSPVTQSTTFSAACSVRPAFGFALASVGARYIVPFLYRVVMASRQGTASTVPKCYESREGTALAMPSSQPATHTRHSERSRPTCSSRFAPARSSPSRTFLRDEPVGLRM